MALSEQLPGWDANRLSGPVRATWGKSDDASGDWLPLTRHMADSAAVAGLIWDRWLPLSVRRIIRGELSDDAARTLLVWLASVHDLGKCSPAFAVQVPALADRMRSAGLDMPVAIGRDRSPHSFVSHVLLRDWLVEERRFSRSVAATLAVVVGGHHGVSPLVEDLQTAAGDRQRGGAGWRAAQNELVSWTVDHSGVDPILESLQSFGVSAVAQVQLTGAVIVADWMASSIDHFPFVDSRTSVQRAEDAWSDLQLTAPWRADPPPEVKEQFRRRFQLPPGAELRPVQQSVADAAASMPGPGLIVVEAPMGEGKTEAALLAAEILASRFDAGGCFIALPTLATTDAMFRRVSEWIERLPAGAVSTYLAHGKSALNPEFQELRRLGRMVGIAQDDTSYDTSSDPATEGQAVALAWLSGRKKGVLSSFVVGTIDQILMGGLRSRHLVLRHLALAGKVVVIDEVHASDVFMSVYLERVLLWLGAYNVPTVLLSATLPRSRRESLTSAYRRGQASGHRLGQSVGPVVLQPRRVMAQQVKQAPPRTEPSGYPCVTVASADGVTTTAVPSSGRALTVEVVCAKDDDQTLVALLSQALSAGGCVALVRNTVVRAQESAALLRSVFGDESVTLLHSRFLGPDRMRKEAGLRRRLGPPGEATDRPARLIVVGTQVLEQSLDIDFDMLVTDLAPMDLLLQRIGRLHRHPRDPRSRGAMSDPRCVLIGMEDWTAAPPVPVRGSVAVYGLAPLVRSAATVQHALVDGAIDLPVDVPRLVEYAFASPFPVPSQWSDVYEEAAAAEQRSNRARVDDAELWAVRTVPLNLIDWTKGGVGDAEGPKSQARVRDGDDSIEVLVAQRRGDTVSILPWIDPYGGAELPTSAEPASRHAQALAGCTVRLPAQLCRPRRIDAVLRDLRRGGVAAWETSPWLKGQLVLMLDIDLKAELDGDLLEYDQECGLVVTRGSERP